MRFTAIASLIAVATAVSAQTDLSNFEEVGNLPYAFQMAALNTVLPNANTTGAPLLLGAGGATGGISISTSSTWNSYPWRSNNQSSLRNNAMQSFSSLENSSRINGTSVVSGSALSWMSSSMYSAPQEKNAVYSAFVPKGAVDFGRHANGNTEPWPLLAAYNRTDLWSLCPDSYANGQTRLRFNVSESSTGTFDPKQCNPVVVNIVSVEALNLFA